MPWYYYSGRKAVAIPVGDGEVKSVRPHTKVEISVSSANDAQVRTLQTMGVLRICGAPRGETAGRAVVGSGAVAPPTSGPGEPFRFHEFLAKEGKKRIGRPSADEIVAPVDRPETSGDGSKVEGDAVADVQEGEEEGSESTSRSRKRSRRRKTATT